MTIENARTEIDKIDSEMIKLFEKRMSLSAEIAAEKKEKNLPVFDEKREQEILEKLSEKSSVNLKNYTVELYEKIFELSKKYQEEIIG